MEQPEGFAVPEQECKMLHLWHALYGLKQAGLAWWCTFSLKSEASIFFYKKKGTNTIIGSVLKSGPVWSFDPFWA